MKLSDISSGFRFGLCKYFPKLAIKFHSKFKGRCNCCGDCCIGCKKFKDNKCLDYENRPLTCKVAPFQLDLLLDKKYKNCINSANPTKTEKGK